MKKVLAGSVLALGLGVTPLAQADLLFGVYGEAQYWMTDVSGTYGSLDGLRDFNFDDENQLRLSIAVHHPLPLLPNVRLERQKLESFAPRAANGEELSGLTDAELDLSHDSATFYYRLLDNTATRLHLGVSVKRFDGFARDFEGREWSINETVPTAYAMAGVGLPFTGLSAYVRGHFIAFDDNELRDIEAAVQYRLFDTALLDGSIQVGYRHFSVELDDIDGLYSDLTFKGPFVGFQLHF